MISKQPFLKKNPNRQSRWGPVVKNNLGVGEKGITPLIATVLLIGFTVALAAVIITWGGGFVDTMTKRTSETTDVTLKCATELRFSISRVTCDEANKGYLKSITIKNNGDLDIIEITLRASSEDESDVKTDKLDLTSGILSSFGVKQFTADSIPKLDSVLTVKNPIRIEAIVKIAGSDGKNPVLCNQNVQDYNLENVPNCQVEQVTGSTTTSSSSEP